MRNHTICLIIIPYWNFSMGAVHTSHEIDLFKLVYKNKKTPRMRRVKLRRLS